MFVMGLNNYNQLGVQLNKGRGAYSFRLIDFSLTPISMNFNSLPKTSEKNFDSTCFASLALSFLHLFIILTILPEE